MYTDFAKFLDDDPFEEIPVDARTFVESKDFLGQPALSKIQYDIVESMAQIYKQEDVERVMGVTEGRKYYKKFTKTEIIMALGKGTNIGSTKAWSCEYGWKSISDKLEDYGLIQSIGGSNAATAFYSEGEDEVFKVTTKFGYTFTGNLGHRFLAWKSSRHGKTYATKGAPQMLPISQVQTNDIAAIVGEWEEPKSPYQVTPSEARMIGYMIGDGTWLRKGSHGFRAPVFTNDTPEVQKDFLGIVESLGGSVKEGTSGMGCWNVRVNGMTDWFIKHGLVQDYNELKSWNDAWMNMSRECLSELLNGIWATDGWGNIQNQSFREKEVKGLHVAIEMNSESLMSGIHMALLRLGVFSSFRSNRPLRANGKHNPTWRVSITNPHFINKFLDTVGLPKGKEKIFRKIEAISREKRYKNLEKNGPVYRDRIVSIEPVGKQEVFSCTVESYHNYLGNGFIHGNSGKDFTSTVGVAYVVYKLLCLKDPARYYGKPPGDAIDIINVAINAQQAKNVFFKGFKNKIERSPWFAGRYYSKMDSIEFDKAITVYSGHSERESHEGLNLFMAILDEISGFGENANNIELGKSGANIYKAFRGTVDSRFPDYGKVVLLSFTRYEGDFISKKYDESIAEKDVVERKHTFVVNPDLPDDYPDNTFTIEWEEDHITKYKVPHVFALKRPTWEVNPTRSIDDFKIAFYTDPADAKMRFLCLEENQKVWTSQGMQNIGDVRVGDLVESRFGPTRILRKEFDHKDCISIVLKNGQELVCTPDHKLLRVKTVRRGRSKDGQRVADRLGPYGLEWVEAGSLSNKDRLLLGSGNSLYSDNGIDEATAYLLGLMLADGNIRNDNRAYLNIACGTNEEYAKNVAALLKQATGFGQVQKQKPNPILSDKVQYNVYSGKRSVATFFTNLGVKGVPAQEKTIPDVVWGMPRQSLLAFVSGFIDGDGTVSNQSGCISMYSTSKTMLTQMQLLVKALWGVTTQIGVSSRPKEGIVTSRYTLYGLRLNKAETLVALPELNLLAKSRPGPNPFVDKNKGRYLRQFAEVVSIESAGEKKVVDIQTEVGEFVSNGIVVHNCQPTVSSDAFFRNKEKLQNAMSIRNPLDSNRRIEETWKPNPDKVYFVHADLAQRVDKCAVAVAHVEKWVQIEVMNQYKQIVPLVVVDMIAWWEPQKSGPVNLSDVKNWIINLRRQGVNLGLVTFDRWQSFDIMNELKEIGIRSEVLSVAKKHYEDLAMLVYEDRVSLPQIDLLLQELTELKVVNDKKVDHPRKGAGKDLSDAMCGAVFNAISRTIRDIEPEIEIHTWAKGEEKAVIVEKEKPEVTEEVKEYLMNFGML